MRSGEDIRARIEQCIESVWPSLHEPGISDYERYRRTKDALCYIRGFVRGLRYRTTEECTWRDVGEDTPDSG